MIRFQTVLVLSLLGASHARSARRCRVLPLPRRGTERVSAPFAQQVTLETAAAHPEIKKIGLHAVSPNETESCLIASPIVSKIGKVSSPAALTVLSSGQSKVYLHAEEGGFVDLGLPLKDAKQYQSIKFRMA